MDHIHDEVRVHIRLHMFMITHPYEVRVHIRLRLHLSIALRPDRVEVHRQIAGPLLMSSNGQLTVKDHHGNHARFIVTAVDTQVTLPLDAAFGLITLRSL
jgi:hypothetical protein